jgi:hypothetical protein
MVERLRSPSTVGWDRIAGAIALLLLSGGFYAQRQLAWRSQHDWTDDSHVDSVGWQLAEGIMLGFQGSDVRRLLQPCYCTALTILC